MYVDRFKELPIMGILRGVEYGDIEPLVETVIASGLKTIEITMNSRCAPSLIRRTVSCSKNRLTIGAGTVLDKDGLKAALEAGATFIVMPVLVPEVLGYCKKHKIPVFPGAFTPQEIYNAWRQGATMVKVFPVRLFGPDYFREIKGPFNDIELLACSGVGPENLASYFSNGASAISFGSSVFKKEWLDKKDFNSIGEAIKRYVEEFSRTKEKI